MARDDDEDAPWTRQLLVGVGVLVAVALVIGAVVSVVALGAARVSGFDDARPQSTPTPSLYIPSGEPTTTPEPFPDPEGPPSSDAASPSPDETPAQPKKRSKSISLQAFPRKVAPNGRINLTGVYQGGSEGARLQVQRFENGWVDFPVTTSVSGGLFDTYVFSGREGANRFRVVDTGSDRKSNAVRVTIG
jgi:hypothetical protein